MGEIEQAIEALDERPVSFDPADMVRAGVFVSLDTDGTLLVERGFVRPEDMPVELEVDQDESDRYDDAIDHRGDGDDAEGDGREGAFYMGTTTSRRNGCRRWSVTGHRLQVSIRFKPEGRCP